MFRSYGRSSEPHGFTVSDLQNTAASRCVFFRLCHHCLTALNQLTDHVQYLLLCHIMIFQHLACQSLFLSQQSNQNMFCSDITVIQFCCNLLWIMHHIGCHLCKSILHKNKSLLLYILSLTKKELLLMHQAPANSSEYNLPGLSRAHCCWYSSQHLLTKQHPPYSA